MNSFAVVTPYGHIMRRLDTLCEYLSAKYKCQITILTSEMNMVLCQLPSIKNRASMCVTHVAFRMSASPVRRSTFNPTLGLFFACSLQPSPSQELRGSLGPGSVSFDLNFTAVSRLRVFSRLQFTWAISTSRSSSAVSIKSVSWGEITFRNSCGKSSRSSRGDKGSGW